MPLFGFLALMGLCAACDLAHKRIPNALSLGGCGIAIGYLCLTGNSWLSAAPESALAAALLAALIGLPGYSRNKLGAGDVKLLLLIGLAGGWYCLLFSIIGAGLSYLLWSYGSRLFWPYLTLRTQRCLVHIAPSNAAHYPYAPFLFVGVLVSLI